jgi:hypothetical protein
LEFLMIVGTETFTTIPMTPKGMFFNNYNNQLFLWGNFLMQRYAILSLSPPRHFLPPNPARGEAVPEVIEP